jgi:tripartite-type tricarboxylate transporter receptor subunit TctC
MHAYIRRALLASCLPLMMSATAALAAAPAAGFPVKPIRMIMPNAPGSGTDTLGRIVAIALGDVLRQQIVIDNRPGAGGTIGMEIGRNANPDGYTIIFASPPSLTIAPFVQKRQPFDPVKDFEFVATVAVTPNVLIVNNALPIQTSRSCSSTRAPRRARCTCPRPAPARRAIWPGRCS